jgi:branched-chain amino acid transport system permease protein
MQELQILLSGVAQGCIYGLVALGFVLIYKATETVSFAQGDLMMVGAFAGLGCIIFLELPFAVALLVSMMAMAAVGWLIDRAVINPVLGEPSFSIVMLTFGLGYLARGLINMIPNIGTDTHKMPVPYTDTYFHIGTLVLGATQAVVMAVTGVLCGLLYLVFKYTRIGIAMQANSQNQLAAYYMGIPVKRLNSLVWALAAVIATVAGWLLSPITFVHSSMGFIGLKALPAAVVGGFGSMPGAIVGGIIIGVVEGFAGFWLPEGFKDIAAYVVVLLMLVFKPHGLFGDNLRKKV